MRQSIPAEAGGRSGADAPFDEQEAHVGAIDDAVVVEVLGAPRTGAPGHEQRPEVGTIDQAVGVEVGSTAAATAMSPPS